MKTQAASLWLTLVLAWLTPTFARAGVTCAELIGLALPHATVAKSETLPAGSATACKIDVASHPTPESDIRIEVWIPDGAAWNGRYLQLGNGGFAGSIASPRLQALASAGYAVAMTDDGHEAAATDGRWALGHPEKVVDFGWRALKETTDIAKGLIVAYRGAPSRHAYFLGCSDGGREALMEAQRFPDDFDGIVAGAPAYYFTGLLTLAAYDEQVLSQPGAFLPADKLGALEAAAQAACGGGFFIADPASCQFDPTSITRCSAEQRAHPGGLRGCLPESQMICSAGEDRPDCVSAAQARAAALIYRGLSDRNPGFTPGEEDERGAWVTWMTGPSPDQAAQALQHQFAASFWGDFVYGDPNFDILKLDVRTAPAAAAKLATILDATNPNLSAFRAHGGKLIQYHGWNDPAIPARGSIVYYEDVQAKMGDTSDFYRLYMIPGMLHCGGGPGPGQVDWLDQITVWVEQGKAPTVVMARRASPGPGPESQQLCPYPAIGGDCDPGPPLAAPTGSRSRLRRQ